MACLPGDRHETGLLLFALAGNAAGFDGKADAIDDGMGAVALDDSFQFEVGHRRLLIGNCRGKTLACPRCKEEQAEIYCLSIIILIYPPEP